SILDFEQRRAAEVEAVEPILGDDGQAAKAIISAANEVDAAGLGEIADRHRDIAEPVAEPNCLNQELCIKDKIVGVVLKGHPFQNLAAVDAEAAVEIA